jgi:small subunit ribosomal protein S1
MDSISEKDDNSFEELFEKSLAKMEKLVPGQSVKTRVVAITGDCVFLQLSGKSEGILDKAEVTKEDGTITVQEGDEIDVFFLSNHRGEMRFTTRISGQSANDEMIENAYKNKIPVEGVVDKEIKGGYEVTIGTKRAFCPFSQIGLKKEENTTPVGRHLIFSIIEYKDGGKSITVSHRAILNEKHEKNMEALKDTLHEGMTVSGKVVSIQSFGAFIDIQGFQALLPISEISRERITSVESVLQVGQTIDVIILRIDWKLEKMSVSLKALQDDPWASVGKYEKDSKHTGKVVRITNFGVFVSLEPGIDGLLHNSEIRGDDRYNNVQKVFKNGDTVTVLIKDVDIANKRISLKQLPSKEEEDNAKEFLKHEEVSDTYNPFAALLKKK